MSPSTDVLRLLREENNHLMQENLTLRNEITKLRRAFHSIFQLQNSLDLITPQTDPFTVIDRILSGALEAINSEDGSLMLLDEETKELVFVHVLGVAKERLTGYRLPAGEGIASWVVDNKTAYLVPDASQEPLFSPLVDQFTGFQTTSLICVPLMEGNRVLGAIEAVNTLSGEPFTEEDVDIMLLVARLATIAIMRAEGSLTSME